MVAIATPMHDGGEVDFDSLAKYVEFHIENDTDALVPAGTTGESATLNVKEHCEVIKKVVDQVNGAVPIIAGTGANSTQEAIELTEAASKSANAPIGAAEEVIYPKNLGCPLSKEWLNNKSVALETNSVAGLPFWGKGKFPNIFCNWLGLSFGVIRFLSIELIKSEISSIN